VGYKNIHPRNTLLKIYCSYFDSISPAAAEVDKEGRFLLPRERQPGSNAKPSDRFRSRLLTRSGLLGAPSFRVALAT
jgi:hypothetical protein